MPIKKPVKKNPFLLFAEEKKIELEKEGKRFPGGMKGVIDYVGKFWEKLTPEERLPYQEKAKQLKKTRDDELARDWVTVVEQGRTTSPVYTFQDEPVELPALKVLPWGPFEERMPRTAGNLSDGDRMDVLMAGNLSGSVDVPSAGNLSGGDEVPIVRADIVDDNSPTIAAIKYKDLLQLVETSIGDPRKHVHMLISIEPYLDEELGVFIPAEVGLTAFSLCDGIIDNFAVSIDPGTISINELIANEVFKACSSKGFKKPDFSAKKEDYRKILKLILKFMDAYPTFRQEKPFLYCLFSDRDQVRSGMKWLHCAAGVPVVGSIEKEYNLRSLGALLYELTKAGSEIYDEENEDKVVQLQKKFLGISLELGTPFPYLEYKNGVPFVNSDNRYTRKLPKRETGAEATTGKKKLSSSEILSLSEANEYVETDDFSKVPDISCKVHMLNQNYFYPNTEFCPLNKTNRRALVMLDLLIGMWGIRPKEGVHFLEVDHGKEQSKRLNMIEKWMEQEIVSESEEDVARPSGTPNAASNEE